jgi:hypothetical protein
VHHPAPPVAHEDGNSSIRWVQRLSAASGGLLTSPFFYRRFVAHRPIPPKLVDDVIAHVLSR